MADTYPPKPRLYDITQFEEFLKRTKSNNPVMKREQFILKIESNWLHWCQDFFG